MIFTGLKPAVVAFIANACIGLFLSTLFNLEVGGFGIFDLKCIALFVVLLVLKIKKPKLHPILFISIAALSGILFKF
jgi:hypothetical protein